MITGTPGDDNLANTNDEITPETIDALAGDDFITVTPPWTFEEWVEGSVTVHGGEGFDTLRIYDEHLSIFYFDVAFSGAIQALKTPTSLASIFFDGIERLILTGYLLGSGDFVTGAIEDVLLVDVTQFERWIRTREGNDTVAITGRVAWFGIDAGPGDDLVDTSAISVVADPYPGPQFYLTGGEGNDRLIGTTANDELRGDEGDDVLTGNDGSDELFSGAGRDTLIGGRGDDYYHADMDDVLVELDGEGNDTVFAYDHFTLPAGAPIEHLVARGLYGDEPFRLTGNEFDNAVAGNRGANSLRGGGGDDRIFAYDGDDLLDGGEGSDRLYGHAGNDRYFVDAGDEVYELENDGFDAVYARTSYALAAGQHIEVLATADSRLTDPLALTGNEYNNAVTGNHGNNRLRGGGGDDSLRGAGGHDILEGGDGRDMMMGGAGDDIYFVDHAGDRALEESGQGFDFVYASASFTLTAGSHVEVLSAADYRLTDALDLGGNEFNNAVAGNNGANGLRGGGGDDSLRGLGGADMLDGGAGRDYLIGGDGEDVFRFSSSADSAPAAPDRIVDFLSGTDRIDLSPIDADTAAAGDQAFVFVGTNAFSGTAGELRYDGSAGQAFIYGDTNGDKVADLCIIVASTPVLEAGDFIL